MKENYEEVKKAVYAGMGIFISIKDDVLVIDEEISIEDKKYLSLYLGILNTKNSISLYLKEKNIKFRPKIYLKKLTQEEYLNIYNNYFVNIFKEISFSSIEKNLDYLLGKKVVMDFNRCNGYYVTKTINDRNKQLLKSIK